ncbi:MarR family transcriptional regulator [Ancylobacter sp. MQZ15Z-1]|uniref:MarR family transcriptional regulator n=1 Tax=Ancylobacter mangrovi TaxID=2972472 RepID=A0A9X2PI47_9HYPH|nr:MarR family transcriptional regulator [Ancylobacter mangrovi]MCS0495662.1 MarR family transcriptional regulator [Ancylobacter mangrovi]
MDNEPTLGFLLHDVARLLRKRFEQRAKESGLTRTQWQTLAYLSRNEGIQQGCLADMLEVEPITLARVVDKLEQRGLIERRAHPTDRRVWLLYLREGARPLIEQMHVVGDATRHDALEGLSAEKRRSLVEALSMMKSNLVAACAQTNDEEALNG